MNKCSYCKNLFFGDKYRAICKTCDAIDEDALTKEINRKAIAKEIRADLERKIAYCYEEIEVMKKQLKSDLCTE